MKIKTCRGCGKDFPTRTLKRQYCDGPCVRAHEAEGGARRAASHSPERRRVYSIVQSALVRGRLIRGCCEVCDTPRGEAHHDDYAAPLDVRWLCRTHHKQHHLRFGPGKNAFIVPSPTGDHP